jgi:alpha,alpha-trehalase
MMSPTPASLFGPIFAAVQEQRLFADSKSFADAIPLHPVDRILSEWASVAPCRPDALRAFVDRNFALPGEDPDGLAGTAPIADHIAALWPVLTRRQDFSAPGSSEIALPRPFVVPGGRFRELYYWDGYFTSLGLVRSGRQDLVEDMIANFGSLLDRFGHIPNGTRTYYLSRSHPPFFYLMAALSRDGSEAGRRRRLEWMRVEHRFWMDGADRLAPGTEGRRVVRLSDGALLNRYWDDADGPRDESWREDVTLAGGMPGRDSAGLWRDIRAAAESGWDFSSRWLDDGHSLATIRTTRLVPIDLNCLIFGLEQAIADEARALGDTATADLFAACARTRAAAITRHLWNGPAGFFADYDLDLGGVREQLTAATAFALFTGICDPARARRVANALEQLLRPGGLLTTLSETDQQWDAPNGWAPLQWIAAVGLRRYGRADLAAAIGERWIAMVDRYYRSTGLLLEKYDVERGGAGAGGEYVVETGFGWTNGVTLAFLAMTADASAAVR